MNSGLQPAPEQRVKRQLGMLPQLVPQNCYSHFIDEFDTIDPGEFILEASLALLP